MTDALYLDDSSVRTFDATVTRALDDRVVLDRTHFYPEGGGQPADRGTLAADGEAWTVTDVQKRDTVYHHVSGEPPAEGTVVRGELDGERRDTLTRYHTAQHLLSAVLLDEFDAETTGNQIYTDYARLDAARDRFTGTDLADVEARLNALVEADTPVTWYTMDREVAEAELDPERTRIELLPDSITELRIVEIEGPDGEVFDRTACAGTHVPATGAIGEVTVTGRETAGAGEERVRFRLD
ncbi:alanyl-tRNA editing protein [Halosegnis marinus]|uniref:Alanyl-tRNA editing protein n=1 Tax=Halosegnis marinus TaxID=3034023 RepID=A0ABD5ZR98_9EURY|nr:alanyl-tRNA editing protein [Halosegnis sp. DT85]